jgi:hypothetical protein
MGEQDIHLSDEELKLICIFGAAGGKVPMDMLGPVWYGYQDAWDACAIEQKELKPGDPVVFWEGVEADQEPTVARLEEPPEGSKIVERMIALCPWFRYLRVWAPHYPAKGRRRVGHVAAMLPISEQAFVETVAQGEYIIGSKADRESRAFMNSMANTLRSGVEGTD